MPETLFENFIRFAEKRKLSEKLYVVGGAVRDMFMNNELKDIDIAFIGNALELAKDFASEAEASYVLLDEDFSVARVVKGNQVIDLANMRYGTLDIDLSERDLTINAMALPLRFAATRNIEEIIDPLNGLADIKNRVIRMVADENFMKDPLRMLRVYRFAAILGYSIEDKTREAVRAFAPMLTSVPGERIAEELRHIFKNDESCNMLSLMAEDGLFQKVFAKCDPKQALDLYCGVEEMLDPSSNNLTASTKDFVKTNPVMICLKLSTLFQSEKNIVAFSSAMKISRQEAELTKRYFCGRNLLADLRVKDAAPDSKEAVGFLIKFRHDIYPLSVLATAMDRGISDYCKGLISFYETVFKKRESLLPLINGYDIKKEFALKASPLFKKILDAIELGVLEGNIAEREQALSLAREVINRNMI
ncbi:MAG: CCA tRNA nucleotidyltransferase [Nitrospirae bacterium]|nr:MAG: CCA tRNA nucleotidyltransferase [Nitrospirota bacterium]